MFSFCSITAQKKMKENFRIKGIENNKKFDEIIFIFNK
jgi:hypothetical protein